ncbi:MAG: CAP domain-containing protein [Nitriliruptorales bacterium]|nr:CAP domain-containing protein [Nitriliruptorales bacterium]
MGSSLGGSLRTRTTTTTLVLLALATALLTVTGALPAVAADANAEAQLVSLINRERRQAGLHELVVRSDLRDVSRRHSARMAERGELYHNPNRTSEVCCWQKLAENVAYDDDLGELHRNLMASSGHSANILSPDFTELGVGVEYRDGFYWVTQLFRLPKGATPPPPSPPEPEPEPEAASPTQPADHSTRRPAAPRPEPPPAEDPPPTPAAIDRLSLMVASVDALEADPEVTDPVGAAQRGDR